MSAIFLVTKCGLLAGFSSDGLSHRSLGLMALQTRCEMRRTWEIGNF